MKVINLILGIGIFLVYLLALNYGMKVFVGEPQWDEYCKGEETYPIPVEKNGSFVVADPYEDCRKEFDAAQEKYANSVFLISLIVGLITLVIGYFAAGFELIGGSLLASGVGAIVFGTISNWMYLKDVWRFVLLLLALALLIFFAYRLNTKKKWWDFRG